MRDEKHGRSSSFGPHSSSLIPAGPEQAMAGVRRVRVGVSAPDSIVRKIIYALEELLTAAHVPHCVAPAHEPAGCDLFYGDHPPGGEQLWMTASRAAWSFFEQPGVRVEQVDTLPAAGGWVRLPAWSDGTDTGTRDGGGTRMRGSGLPDLAAGAFFFLSRWEEWHAPQRDPFGRLPLAASVFGRGLWSLTECPVEQYARALRRALESAPRTAWLSGASRGLGVECEGLGSGPHSPGTPPPFRVGLSHDVDTVRRWDLRGFARTGRAGARSLLRGRVREAAHAGFECLGGLRARARGRDPHSNPAEIAALEAEQEARSTFFLLVRHAHRWDGTHPAEYQRLLPALARRLTATSEIGLHAGTTAGSSTALRQERERLEQLTGTPIRGVRFHNLRGGGDLLPEVAAAGFEYDSTLGFAEEPGFASGIARPFRPYDRLRDRPLDLVEVPLAVMDTTLLSPRYLGLGVDAGRQRALAALAPLRRWCGAAALLWHNDNLPPNAAGGYADLYSELIVAVRATGGRVTTLEEIVADWKQTRARLEGRGDEGRGTSDEP